MRYENSRGFIHTMLLVTLVMFGLLLGVTPAFAHNYGASAQLTVGSGTVSAISGSQTIGGSEFAVTANGNGKSSGFAKSDGGGVASAGGAITPNGVTTVTNNTSYAGGSAKSNVKGSATAGGSAAQGTDTSATAVGSFTKGSVFGGLSFGH